MANIIYGGTAPSCNPALDTKEKGDELANATNALFGPLLDTEIDGQPVTATGYIVIAITETEDIVRHNAMGILGIGDREAQRKIDEIGSGALDKDRSKEERMDYLRTISSLTLLAHVVKSFESGEALTTALELSQGKHSMLRMMRDSELLLDGVAGVPEELEELEERVAAAASD